MLVVTRLPPSYFLLSPGSWNHFCALFAVLELLKIFCVGQGGNGQHCRIPKVSFQLPILALRSLGPPTQVKTGKSGNEPLGSINAFSGSFKIGFLGHLIPVLRERGNEMPQKAHSNGSKRDPLKNACMDPKISFPDFPVLTCLGGALDSQNLASNWQSYSFCKTLEIATSRSEGWLPLHSQVTPWKRIYSRRPVLRN